VTRTASSRGAGDLRSALAVLVGTLLACLVLVGTPQPAAAHESVTLTLVTQSPTVVGPQDTQEVTVRIDNAGEEPLTDVQADLGVGWRPLSTRSEIAAWADDGSDLTNTSQARESVDRIPPGGSAEVELSLDVAALRLGDDAFWGPRSLSVEVTSGGETLDVLHSFLMYDPDGGTDRAGSSAPDPLRLALVAPVTGPAPDPADEARYAEAVVAGTAEGGALDRLLDAATEGAAALSLAVDPAVVAAVGGSGDPEAAAWDRRLRGADDIVLLPPYDTDLAALAHAGAGSAAVAAATDPATLLPGAAALPTAWDTTVAWPQGVVDQATLAVTDAADAGYALVAEGVTEVPGAVPAARDTVSTTAGDVPVVVADGVLSDLVEAGSQGGSTSGSTLDVQRLLAETAVLAGTAVDAGTTGTAVAALPRGWSPDVDAFESLVTALDSTGWVETTGFGEVLAAEPRPGTHTDPEGTVVDDAELAPDDVRRLLRAGQAVEEFASVAADPAELTGPVGRDLVSPLALAYRDAPQARDAATRLALTRADQVRTGISVGQRGDVTLISDSGALPVRVRNDLPVDATVTVSLTPSDPRVVVETSPTVVVPAGESRDAQVRVRAIGSGDVDLAVEVLAPSGVPVAEPTSFAVRVRAGWETVGTAVIAVAVALLFLGGIWRTIRRGRSDSRTTGTEVAESVTPAGDGPPLTDTTQDVEDAPR